MSDPKDQTTIIPHSQQPLVTRTYPSAEELEKVILSSADAQKQWAKVPLSDRITIVNKFVVSAAISLPSLVMLNAPCRFQG
jgi:acyl-CoA reductase-like NAD-dependent aldehyde dehydrogenase